MRVEVVFGRETSSLKDHSMHLCGNAPQLLTSTHTVYVHTDTLQPQHHQDSGSRHFVLWWSFS